MELVKLPPVGSGGFEYEKYIVECLKNKNILSKNHITAGAASDLPDAVISLNKKDYNLEIKQNKSAMMGQLELKYDNCWKLSEKSKIKYPKTVEYIISAGIIDIVNESWKAPTGDYEEDLKLGNIYVMQENIDLIYNHYFLDRKTHYIHIGKSGTYHFSDDIAEIGTSKFNGKTQIRARMKYRGTNKKTGIKRYGSLLVFSVRSLQQSNYDLEK